MTRVWNWLFLPALGFALAGLAALGMAMATLHGKVPVDSLPTYALIAVGVAVGAWVYYRLSRPYLGFDD